MRAAAIDLLPRAPGVRQIGTKEDEVLMAVGSDVVSDVTLAEAVQRHRQFEFRVVVPFEGKGLKAAMEHRPGAVLVNEDFFEEGLHHVPRNPRSCRSQAAFPRTGWVQKPQRRASIGISLRHSGHFLVVGSAGAGALCTRAISALIGVTTKK